MVVKFNELAQSFFAVCRHTFKKGHRNEEKSKTERY